MLLRKMLCAMVLITVCSVASAEVFVIRSIQVNGLKLISLGTVLSYLPIKAGDKIDTSETKDIIRTLYEKNFFSDISLKRSGNDLVIDVVERSVISTMEISGNSKLTKKQLLDALKNVGIAEGRPLDPAILNAIQHAIIQQYYSMSLYNPKVSVDIKPDNRDRVKVMIKIHEGPVAKIKSIRIIGNKAFKEKTLLREMSLTTTKLWSFLTDSDKYSREKLDADLEKIRSYYMDRGYLTVKTDATKVGISPGKNAIYITVNISEGDIYRFGKINVKGDLLGKRSEILKLVTIKEGDIFSRKEVVDAQAKINLFLGDLGYGLADIRIADQDINENLKSVGITFMVTPGHLVYVHHIDFIGNHKTNDNVLRREMRLQEGSLFSLSKINESNRRLANLGYLQDIDHKIAKVPDSNNQVDLSYEFKETSAISANFQGGYSDRDGFLYGANLSDQDIFGTGKTASIGFDNTKATQYYKLGYRDPYFTIDKIGLSVSAYVRKTNPNKISGELSGYTNSVYGADVFFDIPLSDYSQYGFGLGIEHISINHASNPNKQIEKFLNDNGTIFNEVKFIANYSYSNFDKAPFPTRGFGHSLGGEIYGPLNKNGLMFYKAEYDATLYYPLLMGFIMRANTGIGYGDGFGKTKELFFLKNFFAGGIGTIRGFEADTITNDSGTDKNSVIGGNILALASGSIIIPTPMKDTIRPSIFIDVGSVYNKYFKPADLRASYGLQVEWRTPLAPLIFSIGWPLRKKSWDNTQAFQWSISASI